MKFNAIKKYYLGLSLFEVVFAVGLVALILTAIVLLSTRSIKTSDFSQNRAMAGKYAQEATEWFRIQRDDLGWTDFYGTKADGVIHDLGILSFSPINNEVNSTFKRVYTLTKVPPDKVQLFIRVWWNDSEGEHEVLNTTWFTNWNK